MVIKILIMLKFSEIENNNKPNMPYIVVVFEIDYTHCGCLHLYCVSKKMKIKLVHTKRESY